MRRCANTMIGAGPCAQRVMPEPMAALQLCPQFAGFIINMSEVQL